MFFSSLRKPETRFWHQQGHQRAGVSTGSINMIQNINITVNGVEKWERVITIKLRKRTKKFQKQSNSYFINTFGKVKQENAQT